MLENKAGGYEGNNKAICLNPNCQSKNIEFVGIKPIIQQKIGLQALFTGGIARITYKLIYRCLDCGDGSSYPIYDHKKTNQNSTTEKNTLQFDTTQNT